MSDIHNHWYSRDHDTENRLCQIETKIDQLISLTKGLKTDMANDFTALQAAAKANSDAIDAADADINNLLTQLGQTPPSDQPTIDALTAQIQAKTAALIAASAQTGPAGSAPTPSA